MRTKKEEYLQLISWPEVEIHCNPWCLW